jgi:GNAT superfamily N-acetyltransferase
LANQTPEIAVQGLTDELVAFYGDNELDRGEVGKQALDWTFRGADDAFCVMRSGSEIVGLSAYIRSRFKYGEETGSALQAVDSYVSSSMRGKGVFTQLARTYSARAEERGVDCIWGFPNANAAPAWFGKLGWTNFGQVPFLVRPLRAGYFLRRLRLPGDFSLTLARDRNLPALPGAESWIDDLWAAFSAWIGCATIRDRAYIAHRLFSGPHAAAYRVVGSPGADGGRGALVATREADKHGGKIGYLMEAMGGPGLDDVLKSELARMRDRGTELVLAWCYPWSPNYRVLRKCGFLPFPPRLRPITIWFGAKSYSTRGAQAGDLKNWYLSYLDSDTV